MSARRRSITVHGMRDESLADLESHDVFFSAMKRKGTASLTSVTTAPMTNHLHREPFMALALRVQLVSVAICLNWRP